MEKPGLLGSTVGSLCVTRHGGHLEDMGIQKGRSMVLGKSIGVLVK